MIQAIEMNRMKPECLGKGESSVATHLPVINVNIPHSPVLSGCTRMLAAGRPHVSPGKHL